MRMALLVTSLKKVCREHLSLGTSRNPGREGRETRLSSQQSSRLDMKELGLTSQGPDGGRPGNLEGAAESTPVSRVRPVLQMVQCEPALQKGGEPGEGPRGPVRHRCALW